VDGGEVFARDLVPLDIARGAESDVLIVVVNDADLVALLLFRPFDRSLHVQKPNQYNDKRTRHDHHDRVRQWAPLTTQQLSDHHGPPLAQ
jgi:hypothetical protein